MNRPFYHSLLSRELIGLLKAVIIILSVLLFLFEFGFRSDRATDELLDRMSFGLVVAAALATLASLMRARLYRGSARKAEVLWFLIAMILISFRLIDHRLIDQQNHWPYLVFLAFFILIELSRLE